MTKGRHTDTAIGGPAYLRRGHHSSGSARARRRFAPVGGEPSGKASEGDRLDSGTRRPTHPFDRPNRIRLSADLGFMRVIVSAVDYDLRTVRARVRRLHGSEVRIFPTVDEAVDTRARGSSRPHVGPWRHAWRLLWPVAPARGFRFCQRLSRRARCTVRIPLHGRRNLVHQPPNRAPLHCSKGPASQIFWY